MATRSSFANAPVSQFWVLGVSSMSIFAWAFHWRDLLVVDRHGVFNWALWKNATAPFVCSSVTELLMDILLLQGMRTVERRMGSNKFAGLTFIAASIASILQVALISMFPGRNFSFGGPNAVIFALLVQYMMDVPSVAHFRFLGVPMTEKTFTYLMASSLALMQGGSSTVSCAVGALVGILYRAKGVGLTSFRFPTAVQQMATRIFRPFLSVTDQSAAPRVTIPTTSGNPADMTGGYAARGARQPNDIFANRNRDFEPIPEHLMNHVAPSEPNIAAIVEMGFSRERAMAALSEHGDSVDMALNSLVAQDE